MKSIVIGACLAIHASALVLRAKDEVDELLEKQDEKDAAEVASKEFNDAGSKMNQIGQVSKKHSNAEDEDYMASVFSQYSITGKDEQGNATEENILTKDKAQEASMDIIMKWNDLPEANAKKYLETKFDSTWEKTDVNN